MQFNDSCRHHHQHRHPWSLPLLLCSSRCVWICKIWEKKSLRCLSLRRPAFIIFTIIDIFIWVKMPWITLWREPINIAVVPLCWWRPSAIMNETSTIIQLSNNGPAKRVAEIFIRNVFHKPMSTANLRHSFVFRFCQRIQHVASVINSLR